MPESIWLLEIIGEPPYQTETALMTLFTILGLLPFEIPIPPEKYVWSKTLPVPVSSS